MTAERAKGMANNVLILVLVEHTLRGMLDKKTIAAVFVLILVLVEHTLRAVNTEGKKIVTLVLILVLVEHTLRASYDAMEEAMERLS